MVTHMAATDETTRAEFKDRAGTVAEETGSRLERLGLGRTVGGLIMVVGGILVLAMPELLTLVVGVGSILLGVLALASADEHSPL